MTQPSVLITGAARGLGRALALCFAKNKFRVGVNYFQSEFQAQSLAQEIKKLGGEPLLLKADISDSVQVKKMFSQLFEKWNFLDVLINNAGVTRDKTILKMSDEEWNQVIRTNLNGPFWCLREYAQLMTPQKKGSVINIGSIVAVRGALGSSNYAASKAGLIALTKSAARELGRFNICVNLVLPGFHLTDMNKNFWPQHEERIRAEHVLPQLTDLNEFTEFIVDLSQKKSVSGQIFNFDSRII